MILDLLATEDWPLDAKVALEAGRAHGINERRLRRASQRLGTLCLLWRLIRKKEFIEDTYIHRGQKTSFARARGNVSAMEGSTVDEHRPL